MFFLRAVSAAFCVQKAKTSKFENKQATVTEALRNIFNIIEISSKSTLNPTQRGFGGTHRRLYCPSRAPTRGSTEKRTPKPKMDHRQRFPPQNGPPKGDYFLVQLEKAEISFCSLLDLPFGWSGRKGCLPCS